MFLLPLQPFPGFNTVPFDDTEKMVQFHIYAANTQLRQAYYGFVAALGLGRVLVMPKVGLVSNISVIMIGHNAPSSLCPCSSSVSAQRTGT